MTYTLRHVDTCLPCYLQDHHNRDGELLLSIPVHRNTRVHDVLEQCRYELQTVDTPQGFDYDAAEVALCNAFHGAHRFAVWDKSLERITDEDAFGESCYAYFVLYYGEGNNA